MRRLPPISTLTDTPCPDTTLFRSSACGGGGEIRLVYPPQATIQQLTLHADGRWSLNLRVENFSNVSARIDNIDLTMQVNGIAAGTRSEEHTSELQSLMRISYAVFCLKKNKTKDT